MPRIFHTDKFSPLASTVVHNENGASYTSSISTALSVKVERTNGASSDATSSWIVTVIMIEAGYLFANTVSLWNITLDNSNLREEFHKISRYITLASKHLSVD